MARDASFKTAYNRFLEEPKAYRDQLPGQLAAELNDAAKDLYNALNRTHRNEDKISAPQFQVAGDGKIGEPACEGPRGKEYTE